ncbi:MAG: adenine-specific methyltransferase EcoRI family protein [Woeseiaceae bacterium]|nr:adenine-specific methyltransferase EcoRI family protein [Woeseiaceae bacterium]
MAERAKNRSFQAAKKAKQDEFYTQLSDIEKELKHYKRHFKGKVVYCNCDDPRVSNFFHYFSYNFERLGLKRLITTCYKNQEMDLFSRNDSEQAIYLEYDGDTNKNNVPDPEEIGVKHLNGDGDFRSEESIELLKQADIVVTNPPFSLFRDFVSLLIEQSKKFVIVGNQNAITYKEIFEFIKNDEIWVGYKSGDMAFRVPDYYEPRATRYWEDEDGQKWRSLGNACWFTNLDISKRHEEMILYKTYSPEEYPKYVNYDAIEVGKTDNIPADYDGEMGVPITFLNKYNPDQFEIVGSSRTLGVSMSEIAEKGSYMQGGPRFYLDNGDGTYRRLYDRLVIKKRVRQS